ncbi:MAG: hypothetical protein AAF517_01910, partial [Planctomycetota bacterium]
MSRFSLSQVAVCAAAILCLSSPATMAQTVKGGPRKGAEPPIANFRGLVPGVSNVNEVKGKLGEPASQARWYAWKLLYPAGDTGLFDSIHLQGDVDKGVVGTIECVTVPGGCRDLTQLVDRFGPPEFHLVYPGGQQLADYSERGVRFTLDEEGKTIGAAMFPHGFRRVHSGARRKIDLSGLVQGARSTTTKGVDPDLQFGYAEIDISPTAELYKRKFTVHDVMKARCAVVARGELRVAIVGADLFGMLKSEIDPIEKELRKHGISHLLVAMSHNHAAPDTIGIYGYYPKDYVAYIQKRIVRACLDAMDDRRPAETLRLGSDDLSLRGARVAGLIRNARNPGIVDPQIAVIQPVDSIGKPIVNIVHFACHVEGLEKGTAEISADFPGYLCDRLRKTTGAPTLFLNGALGGMVSGDTKARTHEEAKTAGEAFAAHVERILKIATPTRTKTFRFDRLRLEVPVTSPN